MSLLPDSVDNTIKNVTDEPAKSIGSLIKDALYLHFGHVSYKAEKRHILEKYGLIEFERHLQNGLSQIPSANLITPDYQTLMLALKNLEPCLNSEELRQLFGKLIIRSCHSDYQNLIHPSFSETLRQMSPYDAKILKYYIDTKPDYLIAYSFLNDKEFVDRIPYTFNVYPNPDEAVQISISISVLMRLGIISFHEDGLFFPAEDSPFKNSTFYKRCEEERIKEGKYTKSRVNGKHCILTPYGQAFTQICIE